MLVIVKTSLELKGRNLCVVDKTVMAIVLRTTKTVFHLMILMKTRSLWYKVIYWLILVGKIKIWKNGI